VGTQYYRAPTPLPAEWETDLALIRETGLDGVQLRLQWRWVEPRRNEFRFDDHDRLLDLCAARGLQVVVKFIVETAPDYVYHRLGGMRVDFHGRPFPPQANGAFYVGGWQPDFNNPAVMDRAANFVRRCVARYRDRACVAAWHLWNEPRSRPPMDMAGPYGLRLFRAWLADQYGDVGEFTRRFGLAAESFETVLPSDSPTDYVFWFHWRRFCAHRVAVNLGAIREAVRREDATRPCVAHSGFNLIVQNPLADITDDLANARAVERYGTSLVPVAGDWREQDDMEDYASFATPASARHFYVTSLQCDWMRAALHPRRFWVNEVYTNSHHYSAGDLPPADLRWMMLDSIARGADGLLFWQFKEERFLNESAACGLVGVDGRPTPRLEIVRRTLADLRALRPYLAGFRPAPARVAIHHDLDTDLFSAISNPAPGGFFRNSCHYPYKENLKALYSALWDWGIFTDITRAPAPADPDVTPIWILPDMRFVPPEWERILDAYVRGGGTVIAGPGLGERAANLWLRPASELDNIDAIFGAAQVRYPRRAPASIAAGPGVRARFSAGPFHAELRPLSRRTEVLLEAEASGRRFPIATRRAAGKGAAIRLGFYPGTEERRRGLQAILRCVGIRADRTGHYQVSGTRQRGPDGGAGRLVFHFLVGGKPVPLRHGPNDRLLIRPARRGESWRLRQPGDIAVAWVPE
jgi:beta-galactosidase